MALVTGHLEQRDLGGAVAEIESRLRELKLPVGYTYELGGQFASQRQAFRELLMVLAIAAVLVFTILVIQFRAWIPAILILLAAPLSLGGALLFVLLLIGNWMFKVSPESNTAIAVFIGIFLFLFFLQMRKEKRT